MLWKIPIVFCSLLMRFLGVAAMSVELGQVWSLGGPASSATVLQCVPCQLMDRCSRCRLLMGQGVGWEQGQPEGLGGIQEQEQPVWDSS